jgi:hypothetical protein
VKAYSCGCAAGRRAHHQIFGDDVGEAAVFHRPVRAAVDADEQAQVGAE